MTTAINSTAAVRLALALIEAASLTNGAPNYDHLGFELEDGDVFAVCIDGPDHLPGEGWVANERADHPHEYTMSEASFRRQWREAHLALEALL